MKDTLIIIFTFSRAETQEKYMNTLGLSGLRFQCHVQVVNYIPEDCRCVLPGTLTDTADLLLVEDKDIGDETRQVIQHYVNKCAKVAVVYHMGIGSSKGNHMEVLPKIVADKKMCSTEEHSTSGNAFETLGKMAEAVRNKDRSEYDRALAGLVRTVCRDPVLEAKLELLHRLLVPPSRQDVADLNELAEWKVLCRLLPSLSGDQRQLNEDAWSTYVADDPQQYNERPFAPDYVGKDGLLTRLRDSLL